MSEVKEIKAPWDDEQVKSLNEYQQCGYNHPFTCGHGSHVLVADRNGWSCPTCEREGRSHSQNWCLESMANWRWKGHVEWMEKLLGLRS